MKKTLSLILGIFLLAAGLYTISCKEGEPKDDKKMEINLSYVKYMKENHFFMHDLHNNCSIDSLVTNVKRGDSIIWKLDKWSGKVDLDDIVFEKDPAKIIDGPPEIAPLKKHIKIKIKDNADTGRYKYGIVFTPWNGEKDTIDPYIRIQD